MTTRPTSHTHAAQDSGASFENGRFVAERTTEEFFSSPLAVIRTFTDSSGFEPKKLATSRRGRKSASEIRAAWRAGGAQKSLAREASRLNSEVIPTGADLAAF